MSNDTCSEHSHGKFGRVSLVTSNQLDLFSQAANTAEAAGKEFGQATVPGVCLYEDLRLQGSS